MINKSVKKLFYVNGKQGADVRDYELQNAIKAGGIVIRFASNTMTLAKDQCEYWQEHGQKSIVFKSKSGGKDYRLITIPWKPDTQEQSGKLI